ncbi:alpha/beta hydrolase [Nonomuraea sp. NPDC050404]|uniref:alpha/beta hydrolase n=1 Tax=Nonomuraea sp. NPDC050404 TaxID=3155783 RepID=UPI0034115BD9
MDHAMDHAMDQPDGTAPSTRPRSRLAVIARALLGGAAVLVAVFAVLTTWQTLAAGHPAYPLLLAAIALTGIVLLVRRAAPRKPGRLRTTGRIGGAVVLVLALAIAAALRPFPSRDDGVAAAASTGTVEVVHRWDAWELRPRGRASGVGVVFLPGMLVDPRAHFPLLKPLAERGALVIVPTAPLGVALTGEREAKQAIESEPQITTWLVGGHSMGGAAASSVAANVPAIDGLLIWASYPSADLSASDVKVLSVHGSNDPYADDEIINDNRAKLPPDTRYVRLDGGIHAHFGDYSQFGDGEPLIDTATARNQITTATQTFIDELHRTRP